jgi:hypothetical protein
LGSAQKADPQIVADEITRIVSLAPGSRPRRTVADASRYGAEIINGERPAGTGSPASGGGALMPDSSASQPDLPRPVAAMIDATNNEDREALLNAFAEDAVLVDFGRTFSGRASIGQWSDDENIGTHNRIRVTSVSREGSTTTVGIVVTGGGYNGPGTFVFEVGGDRIRRLTIT